MSNSVMIIFSFLFGLAVGSFLNVCIHRIPLKKSIITPPSHCPGCGQKIKFYDNIPIISYIILSGKCRQCKVTISMMYPLIEMITGLLSIALFMKYLHDPGYYRYFIYFPFLSFLVVISFIDLRHQIIPDIISLPGILVGLALSVFFAHIQWYDAVLGAIGGGGILYLVAVVFEKLTGKEGMGGGDIKLLAMIGAWLGWRAIPFIILISSFTGIIIGGVSLILSRKGLKAKIPFGPFLSLGTLVYIFFGREIIEWYVRFLVY